MSEQPAGAIHLELPLTDERLRALKAGDRVLLTGLLYTARDAAHQRLVETIERGELLPIPLLGQCIYYVGPAPARPGEVVGSAGPTTSSRMDPYTVPLLQHGLKAMMGKGRRSQTVRDALRRYHAVYFVAVGGAAALLAEHIREIEVVAYPDLGTEAIHRFSVVNFPAIVANDIYGGDLYELGRLAYRQKASDASS